MSKIAIRNYRTDKPIETRAGLGVQLYHMILGYIVTHGTEDEFCYEIMRDYKFEGHPLTLSQSNGAELNRANDALNTFWATLGVSRVDKDTELIPPVVHLCNEAVLSNGLLDRMGQAWPMPAPRVDKVLTIHIRLGDAPPSWRQPAAYYNHLIRTCMERFPEHTIQTISWGKPDIDQDLRSQIIINYETDGYKFLNHFNEMVHSDILVVAYSSFSIAAGLLNRHTVMCDKDIMVGDDPYPSKWNINFKRMKCST